MKAAALKTGANKTGDKMLRNGSGKYALKCFELEVKSISRKGISSSEIQKKLPLPKRQQWQQDWGSAL